MSTGDWVRGALAWLATYGVHSTLFLGTAWLVCRLRPPRSDANRERLWKTALFGGVVSASLQLAVGARPLLGQIELDAAGVEPEPVARVEAPEAPLGSGTAEPVALDLDVDEPTRPAPERTVAPTPPAPSEAPLVGTVERPGALRDRLSGTRIRERGPRTTHDADDEDDVAPPERSAPRSSVASVSERAPASPRIPHVPPAERTSAPAAAPAAAPGPRVDVDRMLASAAERWQGLVLLGWTAVGLAGVLGLAASWSCLRRRMLGRELLRSGPLVAALARVQEKAGLRRRVRLSVSTRIASPFSLGLLRLEVCVPSAVLTDLGPAQQEALLAHEVAHLLRRDPAWFAASTVLEKLFFFQPLNRVARRQLAELAEVACDDWAVRWTGARLALASCLAEVAGWMLGEKPRRLALPGLGGHRSRLGQRIARLLDDRSPRADAPHSRLWTPLAAGGLSLAALAVPGVAAVTPPPAKTTAPAGPVAHAPEERPSETVVPLLAPPSLTAAALGTVDALRKAAERDAAAELRADGRPALPVLEAERGVLQEELTLLEDELSALRAELRDRALDERFSAALARIDARMAELRAQHARVSALLERVALLTSTPSAGLAPAGGAPAHDLFEDQGAPR